jgi:hypothetical protein
MQFTKYVLPVVVGSMSGVVLIMLGEKGLHLMYPLPKGTDLYDVESVAKYIAGLPSAAFGLELIIYIIASFFAGILSSLLSKRASKRPPVVVGIVLTLAGLYNVINLPQPAWFSVVSMLVYLPSAYLGFLIVRSKSGEF